MASEEKRNVPPMKYYRDQLVRFKVDGRVLQGVVKIADFGGSFENNFHSYDIFVQAEDTLYKHVPEANIFEI